MRTYTKEEFMLAVQQSRTIRETLIRLGLHPAGGSYKVFHRAVKLWEVDTSHFVTSRGDCFKGQTPGPKKPLSYYLSNEHPISSSDLKQKIFAEGFRERKCCRCGITEWQGQPAPLELHHIDGNSDNNLPENLEILCSNCHAQTTNHRRKKNSGHRLPVSKTCSVCGTMIAETSKLCRVCQGHTWRRADYPDPLQLNQETEEIGFKAVGLKYGVTGNSIKKLLQRSGIVVKPRRRRKV